MQWMKRDIVLLHGVTSSGKTEVYIHLIQNALEKHQQVLYILPEIALTVQITQRLQRIFGNQLGIYHSKYNDAERVEIWKKQLSDNPYKVILGVRSSVFLPFQNLGLIIIDEEHETSFKQQDPAPRYHARSVAVMLAKMYNAKLYSELPLRQWKATIMPAKQIWFGGINYPIQRHCLTQDRDYRCEGLEKTKNYERYLLSTTRRCGARSHRRGQAGYPFPKQKGICSNARV